MSAPSETKLVCSKCLATKDLSKFFPLYGKRVKPGTVSSWCKTCHTAAGKLYKQTNAEARKRYAEQRRRWHFKKKFGITVEQYDQMLANQGGLFALCRTDRRTINTHGTLRKLAIDHDHETGRVRALLCETCNRGLGLMRDDPALLRAGATYIERHKSICQAIEQVASTFINQTEAA